MKSALFIVENGHLLIVVLTAAQGLKPSYATFSHLCGFSSCLSILLSHLCGCSPGLCELPFSVCAGLSLGYQLRWLGYVEKIFKFIPNLV